jgi:mannose-1-phosphate guanylyltransferase
MDVNNFCVIMAGGQGSRFWPLSRADKPKQFLDIFGTGKTLLQQTFMRFKELCPVENIYIVTNKSYREIVMEQIPQMKPDNILLEPLRRNTAPCIAYANYKIAAKNKNANIVVAPSDHLILNENEFTRIIKKALEYTSKNKALLTLGIKPSRPETGYGYIQINNTEKAKMEDIGVTKVKTFTEKPEYDMARIFFESGEFYWNSGIFVWQLESIMEAFEFYLPDISELFQRGIGQFDSINETEFIDKTYSECRNISIDYGIIEKAKNVYVLCADFGWSDLGTWGSLYENSQKDENRNAIISGDVLTYDTSSCIVNLPEGKLAVIQGLNDYIVVESNGILLICTREDEQKIRHFVNDVRMQKGENMI